MRSRLALAQALLPNPELLILDEPSDGLDPEGIHEMRQTILRLQRELGLTILLSSHLLNEVEQLCTRIAILQQGKMVFEGNVADVKAARGKVALKTPQFVTRPNCSPSAASSLPRRKKNSSRLRKVIQPWKSPRHWFPQASPWKASGSMSRRWKIFIWDWSTGNGRKQMNIINI